MRVGIRDCLEVPADTHCKAIDAAADQQPPRRRLLARGLHGPPRVEQVSFHCGRRCGHAAPTQVVCFRKAGRPTSFLSEGLKTAGQFHRLCSLLLVWKDFFARCAPPLAAAAPIDGDASKQCPGGTAESPDSMPPNLSEPGPNLLIFEPA